MNNIGTISLETKRLLLRQFTMEDSNAMFNNWASNPNVTKYLTWPCHQNEEVSKQLLEFWISQYNNKEFYQWAIELKSIGQPIGTISVVDSNPDVKMVQTGYCIGEKWWNQGYMSEALREFIRFFFNEVGVNRIEAGHSTANPNSGLVMEKCGMVCEGESRESDRCNMGVTDMKHYAILACDYKS